MNRERGIRDWEEGVGGVKNTALGKKRQEKKSARTMAKKKQP
jgi:hypothetical protein